MLITMWTNIRVIIIRKYYVDVSKNESFKRNNSIFFPPTNNIATYYCSFARELPQRTNLYLFAHYGNNRNDRMKRYVLYTCAYFTFFFFYMSTRYLYLNNTFKCLITYSFAQYAQPIFVLLTINLDSILTAFFL